MTESHSTPSAKPAKPYPDYPLFAHAAGVWPKKIRGKLYYFGPWDDPDGALTKYLEQKDALHAGRKPRPDSEGLTVKALANDFLNHKKARLETGEPVVTVMLPDEDQGRRSARASPKHAPAFSHARRSPYRNSPGFAASGCRAA